MRRLCRLITGAALLTAVVMGCGSTGQDNLVFEFVRWDNTGLTQRDAVGESLAQIDVVRDCCKLETDGTCLPQNVELLTPTVINAVFRNQEAADIHLNDYSVQVNSPLLAQAGRPKGPPTGPSTLIVGGRCSGFDTHCAVDADCSGLSAGGGGTVATCVHTDTTVTGLLLFDIQAKAIVYQIAADNNFQVLDSPMSITVTFFASDDANRSFQIAANYTVTFEDLATCTATGGA